MAITRPITKTIISTTDFGIPVADQVNANTTDIAAMKPGVWQTMTMQNGWTEYISGSYPRCQYRKVGTMLQMRGMTTGGTLGGTFTTLPVGFRPLFTYEVLIYQYGGGISYAQLAFYTDGRCTLNAPAPIGTASLIASIPLD